MIGKTRDGIRLADIVRLASETKDVCIRNGSKHAVILQYPGLRPCPVAESSHFKYMILPWLKQATGYNSNQIYEAIKIRNYQQ